MKHFKPLKPEDINRNCFTLIGTDWMLITAGSMDSFNTMTASWGGLGVLRHKPVAYIFIRPQRHTYQFVERNDRFSLCFFDTDKYRDALQFCGSHSGRDVDKVSRTGLTPVMTEHDTVVFEEARITVECKKLYYQDLDPGHFLDPSIESNYSAHDYHRMYIGEVIACSQG